MLNDDNNGFSREMKYKKIKLSKRTQVLNTYKYNSHHSYNVQCNRTQTIGAHTRRQRQLQTKHTVEHSKMNFNSVLYSDPN